MEKVKSLIFAINVAAAPPLCASARHLSARAATLTAVDATMTHVILRHNIQLQVTNRIGKNYITR